MAPNGKPKYKNKQNHGSMFENDRKEKETQPDFRGDIDINGVTYWISGWKAMTSNGKKRISLSVQLQEERQIAQAANGAHEDGEGWGDALPRGGGPKPPPPKRQVSGW